MASGPDQITQGQFPVRLDGAEAIPSIFATNVAVTTSQHEVTIAFFEALVPIGPVEIAGFKEVKARCVARIVMPLSRLAEVVDLFVNVTDPAIARSKSEP